MNLKSMVEFKNLTLKRVDYGAFKKLYKKIFPKKFSLSVVIATADVMRGLNKTYRGKNKPTNVLSFLLDKKTGEIFLNANEKDKLYLFVHGALHLLGYDHKKNKDAIKMEKLENKILNIK